ncbi:CTP synthase (glutamine hydrolyzing) [Candidatus Woesearchaeota archaeon]|nr:CTP synthase (glutamine hydrolyzing) [Candidatus Woesearchaeota archaeon]
MQTKYIIVVGGVISGVGKGVATASIGKILQNYGYKVTAIKIDPYINFDAGTLRPTEHGEVWVTDDGGEIDQDLGNYERFLGIDLPKANNITTGQVYDQIIKKERSGQYLGETVQFIPHVPEEVKRRIIEAGKNFDIVTIEIGGTIGDYENIPFLFATKSLEKDLGKENVIHILITYLPVPSHINEAKTKPTQQAIKMLSENTIFPDFILCRAREPLDPPRKKKIETYANIGSDYVISAPDIESLYLVPLNFEKEKLGPQILKKLQLKPAQQPDWSVWTELVNNILNPQHIIKVGIVGKYLDIGNFTLEDSYISIKESLEHAAANLQARVNIIWIDSKEFEKDPKKLEKLREMHGIIIPGGFGGSGVEGKIKAIQFCRENKIPFLGLCYGLQLAVVEFARNVCQLNDANTSEVNPQTPYPVIDILPSQKALIEKSRYGGTMRLGAYAATLKPNSQVLQLYQETSRLTEDQSKIDNLEDFRKGVLNTTENIVLERHRHRYEVNPKYIEQIEKHGLIFSGYHLRQDNTQLMEFIELPNHPFFIATQAHPEFKSRLEKPSPLFYGFLKAALK